MTLPERKEIKNNIDIKKKIQLSKQWTVNTDVNQVFNKIDNHKFEVPWKTGDILIIISRQPQAKVLGGIFGEVLNPMTADSLMLEKERMEFSKNIEIILHYDAFENTSQMALKKGAAQSQNARIWAEAPKSRLDSILKTPQENLDDLFSELQRGDI